MGKFADAVPDKWGTKFQVVGTNGIYSSVGANSIHLNVLECLFIVTLNQQPRRKIAINSDAKRAYTAEIGSIELVPPGSEYFAHWTANKHSLVVAIESERLKGIAAMECENDVYEFYSPRLGLVDSNALYFAHQIKKEIEGTALGFSECLEGWITIFIIHILRKYTSLSQSKTEKPHGGLSPRIKRMVHEYIDCHLSKKISIEDLADIANLSLSHFSRAFKQSFGQSPYEFIIMNRLLLAQRKILGTDISFETIAKDCGFFNNSHMTSVMKKIWHITPSQLRCGTAHMTN